MSLHIRPAAQRGHADFGWLNSRHTFSFGQYYDPKHMGFGVLRVINDDRVAGGAGFPTHPHSDMEIISYVLEGGLAHRDSIGTGSIIRPGDVQRMTAGTGIQHSEFNASANEPVHFLQIWVLPKTRGLAPGYEQKSFSAEEKAGRLRLVASPDGRDGAVTIHQDLELYASLFKDGDSATHVLKPKRQAWVQVASGSLTLNGQTLAEGDGVGITQPGPMVLTGTGPAEFLLFDMAQ
jgi:redox-sensitive bicupin YhaK (pirin superfamily)